MVAAKDGKDPYLFLIEGIKGKKATLVVEAQSINDATDFSGE